MYKINCDSDFKIIEGFKDNSSISSSPFKFTYYTRPNREVLEASYDGIKTSNNCRLTEDNKLIVAFDDHQLGTGRLKVRREFYLNDADFQSGICDLVTDEELDIILEKGIKSDCIEINSEIQTYYHLTGFENSEDFERDKNGNFIISQKFKDSKQDTIEDLEDIREGANLGKTALQEIPEEYALKTELPKKVSELDNDSNFITIEDVPEFPSLDEYVTETELNNKGYITEHQSLDGYAKEQWVEDKGYLTEHQDISGKQDTLISGDNIKTINNESLLGSGNIEIKSEEAFPLKTITQNIIGLDSNNANLSGYYGILESFGIKSGDIKLESLTVYRRSGTAQGNYNVRCKVLGVKNGSWYLIAKSSNIENISTKTIAGEPIKFNMVMEENIPVLSSKDTIGIIFSNQEISSSNLGHGVIVSLKTMSGINGGINKGENFNGTIAPNPSIYSYSPAISFEYYSYSNDDSVVHLDKDETINSVKTFNKKGIFNDGISIANKTLISSGIDPGELKVFPQGSNTTKGFIVRSANRGDTIPTVELLATNTQASYTYSFPKKSGTVALLTDIPNTYTKTEIENMIAEAVVSTINSSY